MKAMIEIDDRKKKSQKRQRANIYLHLRQLSAALFFLVVNMVHRHSTNESLTSRFFILAYVVFLCTTVQNLRYLKKLYDEVNNE